MHPALASPAGTDPYSGLGDRDRARWQAFDHAEAWPTTTAGLLPHLVDPGNVVEVERGPRSHTVDLREVRSVERGTGPYAGGLEFKIRRGKSTLFYPGNRLVPVRIPDAHPTLAAAIRAALPAGPGQPETASPAASQAAADAPDTAAPAAPAPASPAETPGPAEPDQPGRYSGRIRISSESGPPTVSGTSYDDPAELREALRANFTWRKKRQLWEYTGRSTGPLEAVTAIRDVLARLDRAGRASREGVPADAAAAGDPRCLPRRQGHRGAGAGRHREDHHPRAAHPRPDGPLPGGPGRLHRLQRQHRRRRAARPVRPQRHRDDHAQHRQAGTAANQLRRQGRRR